MPYIYESTHRLTLYRTLPARYSVGLHKGPGRTAFEGPYLHLIRTFNHSIYLINIIIHNYYVWHSKAHICIQISNNTFNHSILHLIINIYCLTLNHSILYSMIQYIVSIFVYLHSVIQFDLFYSFYS